MSRLTRDGTAESVSRDQILRHVRGQGNIHFSCSADHEQDWQPYPVDPYSAICDDNIPGRMTMSRAVLNLCLVFLAVGMAPILSEGIGTRSKTLCFSRVVFSSSDTTFQRAI